jgi:phage repressor protein C with HTH and peptisase S24 domain
MLYNELVNTLQNLIGAGAFGKQIKVSQQMVADALNVAQGAISQRIKSNKAFTLDERIKIEQSMGLPAGSLSGIQTNEGSIEIDYIHITPSCGRGTVVLDDADVTPVRIGKEVIKDIWKVSSPEVFKLFKASGDSMENTIEDGNILLVDTSRTDYHNGGIYVLTINNDWFVKRLRLKINGDLEIISDNPKYDPEVLRPNTDIEINVVGRVIKNLSRGL